MLNASFIYFSFIAGLAAFFAPCSFALLPGYITHYISKYSNEGKKSRLISNALQGSVFGLIASMGFFTVFGGAGFAVIAISQFIKKFIPWIAIAAGIILIVIGIFSFFGKEFLFFQTPKIDFISKNEKIQIYLFGIVYAVGSLGCVFPIFLSIIVQGIASNSFADSAYAVLAYASAMSLVMILITTMTFAARYFVLGKLERILPYFKKFSAILLIFAGAYMIYYQYLLFK